MNLEELRDVRRTERQRDGLQRLPDSFYRDVADYIAERKAARERAAEAADDPFSAPEVRRLSDEISSAETVVESIYERRVGKVVDRASFAAAGTRHDVDGLTDEERRLFEDVVARIERNREAVLDALDPTAASGADADGPSSRTDPTDELPDGAGDHGDLLAEAMGAAPEGEAGSTDGPEAADGSDDGGTERTGRDGSAGDAMETDGSGGTAGEGSPAADGPGATGESADDGDPPPSDAERTTVYVTRDVGEIFGVDERTYSLAAEDVVTLPADNARALVERDAAKPLE